MHKSLWKETAYGYFWTVLTISKEELANIQCFELFYEWDAIKNISVLKSGLINYVDNAITKKLWKATSIIK